MKLLLSALLSVVKCKNKRLSATIQYYLCIYTSVSVKCSSTKSFNCDTDKVEQGIMGLEHLLAVLQSRQITFNAVVKWSSWKFTFLLIILLMQILTFTKNSIKWVSLKHYETFFIERKYKTNVWLIFKRQFSNGTRNANITKVPDY